MFVKTEPMKFIVHGLIACLAAGYTPAAQAITLFFDLGDATSGVLGGPVDGSNPSLLLPAGGAATLHLWGIPEPGADRWLVSLGFDVVATGPAATSLRAVSLVLDNPALPSRPADDAAPARSSDSRWTGTAVLGGLNQGAKFVSDARAVFVPENPAPLAGGLNADMAPWRDGYDPHTGAIHLGVLTITTTATPTAGPAELRLAVSPLRITNVASDASSTPEPLRLGFAAGAPEPATGTGSTLDATSASADVTLTVAMSLPGDADGDGDVDLLDYQSFVACLGGPDAPPAQPSGCLAPFDFDNDGDVDLTDANRFLQAFAP